MHYALCIDLLQIYKKNFIYHSENPIIFAISTKFNTHSHCVFLDPTQQQGASKLQARKTPKTTHTHNVYYDTKSPKTS